MTDDPPAPEPGASLAADDRGVSTTLGYTLTLSITAVLVAGLLTAGGALIEDQRRTVAADELTVSGQQLAVGFEDADRLAATTDNGTVRVNLWLPEGVAGGGYTLTIRNEPTPPDQPARATIVASAEGVDVTRNVSFRTENPAANRTIPGGPVTIRYNDSDGDGTHELLVEERGRIAPDPPDPVAFSHQEIVYVDADTGELRSVAPSGEITRYGVDAAAIGPKQVDLDDDGLREVPYVTASNELRIVDEEGETQTLASDAAHTPLSSDYTTLLAVGEWNGSTSVFYLNTSAKVSGEASIYRAAPGESPSQVTAGGSGVDATAIAGIGDINDDGDDDIVYTGQSSNLRYIDNDSDQGLGQGVGASAGYGIGDLRQFADGERDALPFVGSGNEIKLYRESAGSSLAGNAAKTSIAGIDWTGNDSLEVVYVGSDNSYLHYVTLGGSTDTIDGPDGNITVDSDTGVA